MLSMTSIILPPFFTLNPSLYILHPPTFTLHPSPLILQSYRKRRSLTLMKPFLFFQLCVNVPCKYSYISKWFPCGVQFLPSAPCLLPSFHFSTLLHCANLNLTHSLAYPFFFTRLSLSSLHSLHQTNPNWLRVHIFKNVRLLRYCDIFQRCSKHIVL